MRYPAAGYPNQPASIGSFSGIDKYSLASPKYLHAPRFLCKHSIIILVIVPKSPKDPEKQEKGHRVWEPTYAGKIFTSTPEWQITIDRDKYTLTINTDVQTGSVMALESIQVEPGFIWATVKIPGLIGKPLNVLDGIANSDAVDLQKIIRDEIAVIKHRKKLTQLLQNFDQAIQPIIVWAESVNQDSANLLLTKGWLSQEFIEQINKYKPTVILDGLSEDPEVKEHLKRQSKPVQDAVHLWAQNYSEVAAKINEGHLEQELKQSRDFFERVEKSPLTDEQAKAVICFDNRVLLVAAAGSGKTSTMVAKAGYALKKGYFAAARILLLAFNNDAAAELRERIKARLEPLGLPANEIVAKTFHAFALDVIGEATGKRPSLAPWVESGRDIEALIEIVDSLKVTDPEFRSSWDIFRLVFGQDLPTFNKEVDAGEWDAATKLRGFRTLRNEIVKSRGEQLIANWLFFNGVNYKYEAPYKIETADSKHRQYFPDFYFPEADAYLEHWALDSKGNPPPEFEGYMDSMQWKKSIHAQNGTRLLETTMADLWSGSAFRYLEVELKKLKIDLDPNPNREIPGRKPIDNLRVIRTIRAFLTHTKSNRLTLPELRKRLDSEGAGPFRYRHEMFIGLFARIWNSWEQRLKAEKYIDFDDMINLASDYVEGGKWKSPYELIMVDEFQDVSEARTRLISGLLKDKGRYLFGVGDDWQSINRFAGADIAAMTEFHTKFGHGTTLKLETTFRCPQSLCDISSEFIQKNPKQIRKTVRSRHHNELNPIHIIRVTDETKIRSAVEARISEIASVNNQSGVMPKIYLLGRYNENRNYFPRQYDQSKVKVEFMTVHSSKGLEADHVIIPGLTSQILGFPSRVIDDPVLQIAMPNGDNYDFAEERRLFYVALTRARQTATLITIEGSESSFIIELATDFNIEMQNIDGSASTTEICPDCKVGIVVKRKGKHGEFFGCNRFPKCEYTKSISTSSQGRYKVKKLSR